MVKGILFDLDGVILDSLPRWMTAGYIYVSSLGVKADKNLGDLVYDKSLKEGTLFIKNRYGLKESRETIETGIAKVIEDFYLEEPVLKEGLKDLLDYYKKKNLPMVICSQTPRKFIEGAMTKLDLMEYFKAIYTTTELDKGKDQPDIYLKGLDSLGLKAEEALLLEDGLFALKTGHDLGLKTALVLDPYNKEDKEGMQTYVDLVVKDYPSFIKEGAGL